MGKTYNRRYGWLMAAAIALAGTFGAQALDPSRYAASSRLASGRWAKVRVNESGMQLITTAQLKNLGFSDPAKVKVYGYGGRLISSILDDSQPDDLPQLPTIKTARGIVFYGVDNTSWGINTSRSDLYYERGQNPYATASYYFISDSGEDTVPQEVLVQGMSTGEAATTFREHLLHEKDLEAVSDSGNELFGEDFRTQHTQAFPFSLPGITGDATVQVRFVTNTSGAPSSIILSANGNRLAATNSDNIAATPSSSFLVATSTVKTVTDPGEKLSLEIKYNTGGVLKMARLDYITVEYDRALTMSGGELRFYDQAAAAKKYTISGCSEGTQVWDVTEPSRPLLIEGERSGDRFTFTSSGGGYREYVAFDSDKVTRTAVPSGRVNNQDIHAMEIPDMLIISPSQYTAQSERIAELHRTNDGMTVHVLTPDAIYNEFSSGTPDISAFRKVLKMWYDRGGGEKGKLKYCLLMGRTSYDARAISSKVKRAGYEPMPQWSSTGVYGDGSSYGTDDFIGMLSDNDSRPGQNFNINTAQLCIGVGRFPVKNVTEATQAVDKLIKYVNSPETGAWRNNILLLADDQDRGTHLDQMEESYKMMISNDAGNDFNYEKLYLDSYPLESTSTGAQYPKAKARLKQMLNEGVNIWFYIGHGHPRGLTHENLYNWTDINSMTNRRLSFMYGATCEFLRWDADEVSGAEIMWLYPENGIIGMYAATRSVYISPNGLLSKSVGKELFRRAEDGGAVRLGDVVRRSKNNTGSDSGNRLRFVLMGDPAMRFAFPRYHVVVDSVGDTAVGGGEMPQIAARDNVKVTGRIVDADGNTVEDYNGYVETTLYDAERVVETYGNGKDGEERKYNARESRLCKSREKVTAGRWETTLLTPELIDNNYSPARLSMYACSEDGREANGANEQLYVYGYNSDSEENPDTDGPEISYFTLNNDSFRSGGIVNESPVVRASMRDDSGICVYGGTIGHQISLKIDDKTYTDVSDYYSPADGDPYGGSILYPLQAVEPGDHTATLTVYDNAGNFTTASVDFRVAVGHAPDICDITTDVNPASTSVTFILSHDRPSEALTCTVDVFDLSGRKVWSSEVPTGNSYDTNVNVQWNLCDGTGVRVPRGIYLYRATVTTAEGASSSKTRKLAVTAG